MYPCTVFEGEVYGGAWPIHLELVKAIGSGKVEAIGGFLDKVPRDIHQLFFFKFQQNCQKSKDDF